MINKLTSLWKIPLTQTLIGVAIFAQVVIITSTIIKPLTIDVLDTKEFPAVERSAILSFGDRFADYIAFILSNTTETNVILVPYREVDTALGNEGIMQYFLFPRRISNCPVDQSFVECARIQAGPNTFILSVDGFPPEGFRDDTYEYAPFDETWGIFIPRSNGQP